jgi:hypothetical protein
MANWKKLAKEAILLDGFIEEKEAELIKREILADGVISRSEAEFLVELRNESQKAVKKFHEFVFEVVKKAILADGDISIPETRWLEKFLLADGVIDEMEKAFLIDLKKSARKTCKEFDEMIKRFLQ